MLRLDDTHRALAASDLANHLACAHLTQQRLAIARGERTKPRLLPWHHMRQLTLRVPDDLASRLRDVAALQGRSVNGLATAVLSAAVDPELEGDEAARVRARLERAGLLAEVTPTAGSRPPAARVAAARRRAGTGTPLSDLVAEGRG